MVRMLIVGYCFRYPLGAASLRRGAPQSGRTGGSAGSGLDGHVPDHSTFSKNRHGRFRDSDLLRRVFETVLQRCMGEGLVGGEAFAIDASLIKADANRQKGIKARRGCHLK